MTRVVYLRRMDFAEKIGRREKYFWRRPKKNTQGDKPMKPHYAFLQLQFQSGNQVDANFRKKIEGTIADYTAAWLKSNSSVDTAATEE